MQTDATMIPAKSERSRKWLVKSSRASNLRNFTQKWGRQPASSGTK